MSATPVKVLRNFQFLMLTFLDPSNFKAYCLGPGPVSTTVPVLKYSETLGLSLGLDQFYGLGLGLEAETQIISVSDSVSILRL